MKKFNHVLALIIFYQGILLTVTGQTSEEFNYQAVVRHSDGTVLQNQEIVIKFTIEDNSGSVYYEEEHNAETDSYGVVNLSVGEGNLLSGSWQSINWKEELLLKVAIDYDKDGTFDLNGTSLISAVPKANYSERTAVADSLSYQLAEVATSGDYADLINKPQLIIATDSLSLEGSNKVALSSFSKQDSLFIDEGILSISGGNSVDLSVLNNETMQKAVYDTNNDGAVDLAQNSNTVNNYSINTSVPSGAIFTDNQNASQVEVSPTGSLTSNNVQSALEELQGEIGNGGVADATASAKGVVQLAGDLTGTADAPLIANDAVTTDKIATATADEVLTTDASGNPQWEAKTALTGNLATKQALTDTAVVLRGVIDAISPGTTLQTELDATQTGAGLGTYGTYSANTSANYIGSVTTLAGADDALDAQVKINADSIDVNAAAIATNASDISDNTAAIALRATQVALEDTTTAVRSAIDANSANIALNATKVALADTASTLRSEIGAANNIGTTLQSELDATQTGAGLGNNGTYSANTSANYIGSATTLAGADDALDAQVKINADSIDVNAAAIATNTSDIADNTAAIALRATQVALEDTTTAVRSAIDANSANIALNATKVALADTAGVLRSEIDAANTIGTSLQSELDATQTGAGLGTDGTYSANTSANYIGSATTLAGADDDLDAQLKINADSIDVNAAAIATNASDISDNTTAIALRATQVALEDTTTAVRSAIDANSANIALNATKVALADTAGVLRSEIDAANTIGTTLQSELDATQTGAGLGTDGTYSANTLANYIGSATSLAGADNALDEQLKINADNIATNTTNITQNTSDISDNTTAISTNADAISLNATKVALADTASSLRSEISTANNIGTTLQSELDATQTGAGLGSDGTYSANTSANYIGSATTLAGADNALDTQLKTNADAIDLRATQVALEDTTTAVRSAINTNAANIALNATKVALADTASSLRSEINAANNIGTTLQTELDATQSGAGLGTDGTYPANTSANYIGSATTLADADDALDAQLKINADSIDVNATAIANNTTAITANTSDISDNADAIALRVTLVALEDTTTSVRSAVDANSANIALNATKVALADTAGVLRSEIADANTDVSNLQTELDATQTGSGLTADGDYSQNSSANYIGSATTLAAADNALDEQSKINADSIAINAAAIKTNTTAIATNTSDISDNVTAIALRATQAALNDTATAIRGALVDSISAVRADAFNVDNLTDTYVPYLNGTGLDDSPVTISSDKVGIGTTNTVGKVSINSGSTNIGLNVKNSSPFDNTDTNLDGAGLVFHSAQTDNNGFLSNIVATGTSNGNWSSNLAFWTASYNPYTFTEKMRITRYGNVGIGTTAPSEKLDVAGNIKATGKVTAGANATANMDLVPLAQMNDSLAAVRADGFSVDNLVSAYVPYYNGSGLDNSRITMSGTNVGIGTTTPASTLHIKENAGTGLYQLIIDNHTATGGYKSGIGFRVSIASDNDFIKSAIFFERENSVSGLGSLNFAVSNNATTGNVLETDTKMTLTRLGNLGIGTTSPTEKLDVAGNIKASGKVTAGANAAANMDLVPLKQMNDSLAAKTSAITNNLSSGYLPYTVGSNLENSLLRQYNDELYYEKDGLARMYIKSYTETVNGGALLYLNRSRGTKSSKSGTQDGDTFGSIIFSGASSTGGEQIGGTITMTQEGGEVSGSYRPANMGFYTANGPLSSDRRERLTILSTGNIGIGRTAPTELLDVAGNIKASGKVTAGANASADMDLVPFKQMNDSLAAKTSGITANLSSSTIPYFDGNDLKDSPVKIGTGNSLFLFNEGEGFNVRTYSNSNKNSLTMYRARGSRSSALASQAGDEIGSISFTGARDGGATCFAGGIKMVQEGAIVGTNTYVQAKMSFYTSEGSTSADYKERLTIASAGNVGIGKTSPTEKLDVGGNIKATGKVTAGAYATANMDLVPFKQMNDSLAAVRADGVSIDNLTSSYVPYYNGTGLNNSPVTVNGTNVGIGTSDPASALQVKENAGTGLYQLILHNHSAATGDKAGIGFRVSEAVGDDDYIKSAIFFKRELGGLGSLNFAINNSTATGNVLETDTKMTLTRLGRLGIGVTSPAEMLDVAGNIKASGTLTIAGNLAMGAGNYINADGADEGLSFDAYGKGTFSTDLTVNGNTYFPSDRRLKTNIETLSDVMDKINRIRGVRFEYKDQTQYATGPKIGVIAQELQKVYPELVTEGADGFLKVDYTQLTGILLQAVKEQQKEIDTLKQQMEMVMKKLDIK